MNPSAPTTYRIIISVLSAKKTSQRELARRLGISIGQVNKVFHWLKENAFVEGYSASDIGRGGARGDSYVLVNPTGLLRAISLFRQMNSLRLFSMAVAGTKQSLISELRSRRVVFCLGTALEAFSEFYRSDEVSFYTVAGSRPEAAERIRESLAAKGEGIARVTCYAMDTRRHGRRAAASADLRGNLDWLRKCGIIERGRGAYFTTKVQTVVDLFCDGRAYAAKDLLRELWGVKL
jgi:DNA-binding Lrp family transcriptional regulator